MRPSKLVLASSNSGKYLELQALVSEFGFDLVAQSDFGLESPDETGQTFVENALIKARHSASQTGLPSLADDSGLIVPALGGEPGLRSARYAGRRAENRDNIALLLTRMVDLRGADRSAFFHCTLVLLRFAEDPDPVLAQGRWSGQIATEPKGDQGFGYDPIFICDQYQCTAAEMPVDKKSTVSHRGKALLALKTQALASRLI